MEISDQKFSDLITKAMDELPQQYIKNLDNVAIVYEGRPTPEQRDKLQMRCNQELFGLYEGIPRTKRGNGYSLVLPDKITIFKDFMLSVAGSEEHLFRILKHTLWHEIAHHYGLDHARIHELENKI